MSNVNLRPLLLLVAMLAYAKRGNSFVPQTLHRIEESTNRKIELQAFGFSISRSTLPEEDADQQVTSIDRRAIFNTGASLAAGIVLNEKIVSNNAPAVLSTLESSAANGTFQPTIATVTSAEEALKIIEARGDKRFLHALVASDYKFLYEQTTTISSEIDAKEIFSEKVPSADDKPRSLLLAATGNLGAKNSPSLWPLENEITKSSDVHYAWPESGGALQPNKTNDGAISNVGKAQKIIVDGIDCGKMSLEDALEGDMQVLVQTPTYLSVPSHMESSLRKGLQRAFLI